MHSQFRLVFFLLVLFVLNAGHAIDRLQPINKMNARIQCTTFYVCECCCYAIVSQLTKYGSTHSVSARSFISFHSCLQREIFLDLFTHFVFAVCISNVRRRVSSATTVTRRYVQITLGGHIFFRVFSFQHSLAGDQCSTFLVLSAFVLLTKKPSTHTSCVLFPLDQVDDVSHNTNNNFLGSRRK